MATENSYELSAADGSVSNLQDASISVQRVYSPNQVIVGSVLGILGAPLAAAVFIYHNFKALGNNDDAKRTIFYGVVLSLLYLAVIPFLPDWLPPIVISTGMAAAAGTLVQQHQFTKQAIKDSPSLTFQSNWRVFGIGLACLILFGTAVIVLFF